MSYSELYGLVRAINKAFNKKKDEICLILYIVDICIQYWYQDTNKVFAPEIARNFAHQIHLNTSDIERLESHEFLRILLNRL